MKNIVCDTGALISLEKLTFGYHFMRKLYNKLIIPPTVLEEVGASHIPSEIYLREYRIEDFVDVILDFPIVFGLESLDQGELERVIGERDVTHG